MKKKLLIILIVSLIIFIVGFGIRFCKNTLVADIGLWVSFVGALLIAIVAVFICFDSYRIKKHQKDITTKKNDVNNEKNNVNKD